MELTIRIGDLLRSHGVAAPKQARGRGEARPAQRRLDALYAGILDAAVRRDFAALRAYGKLVAAEGTRPSTGGVVAAAAVPDELPTFE